MLSYKTMLINMLQGVIHLKKVVNQQKTVSFE